MFDEAHFELKGRVHKQNIRYWRDSNPSRIRRKPLYSRKAIVWCNFLFFNNNENSQTIDSNLLRCHNTGRRNGVDGEKWGKYLGHGAFKGFTIRS